MTQLKLPPSEMPRERLEKFGENALSLVELLAILLGSGTKDQNVLDMSREILTRFGSVKAIDRASIEELTTIKGLGKAKALLLKAALAFARRGHLCESESDVIEDPFSAYALLKPLMEHSEKETLYTILCDVKKRVISIEQISVGTLTSVLAHPREIFRAAITKNAHSIVVAHNHPSGESAPSKQDIELTKVILEASHILGIPLQDHIIIGHGNYYSFKEAQKL